MRKLLAVAALVAWLLKGGAAGAEPGKNGDGSRYLAIYLPGIYFSNLERKLEFGNELAAFLAEQLGENYRLTPRLYAAIEPMDVDAEAGRVVLGLVESPFVASRLASLLPVSVAVAAGSGETRLCVLARSTVTTMTGLRSVRVVHATPLEKPQSYFDNFVFEGEMWLGRDKLTATRDVGSALSLVSLKKADALLLYEGDEALGQNIGLHALYRTTPLPRPTLVAFDRRLPASELARLREAMNQFQGRIHPGLRSFRPTTDAPYQALRSHMEQRPRRLPLLLELAEGNSPLPLPRQPADAKLRLPVTVYAPALDATP